MQIKETGKVDAFFLVVEADLAVAGAAGATVTVRTTLDTDADFLALTAIRDVRVAGAESTVIVNPAMTVELKMSSSGRELHNVPVHIENMAGTAQLHKNWPAPKLFVAGSTISTKFTNLGVASKVRLTFIGYKRFSQTA